MKALTLFLILFAQLLHAQQWSDSIFMDGIRLCIVSPKGDTICVSWPGETSDGTLDWYDDNDHFRVDDDSESESFRFDTILTNNGYFITDTSRWPEIYDIHTSTKYNRALKFYSDNTGDYCIEYVFGDWYSVPLTYPAGEPHYDARITVFMKYLESWIPVCDSFGGIYVQNGCFEDVPVYWVSHAIKCKSESK